MKSEILSTLCCLLLSVPAFAQAPSGVSLKIDLVSWSEDIPGLSVKEENKGTEVTALAFRYSDPVTYAGPAMLELYQKPDAGKATAPSTPSPSTPQTKGAERDPVLTEILKRRKDKPDLVALAPLPADSKRVTILLAPAPEHTYRAIVIDDDPSKLPMGKLRIHNYSSLPIAMRCNGAEGKELKIRESFVVEPKNSQVKYELAYQEDGEWKMQENNVLLVRDTEQVQLFVLKTDSGFFKNSAGGSSGFLQTVILRRQRTQ
ncbi:MAG: hypothetical protein QM755_10240 [Luteolibacter sp.]